MKGERGAADYGPYFHASDWVTLSDQQRGSEDLRIRGSEEASRSARS
jgi:hypothetical protein